MEADGALGAHVLGILFWPARTLRALSKQTSSTPGASAVALLGIFWTILLILLWNGGERPSFVLLPIPRDSYYLIQGLVMTPLITALFWLHSEIAHRLATWRGGKGTEPGARSALGFSYAAPMLFAHVLPELFAYLMGGFETMSLVGRFTLPIAALWVWALSTAALRVVHGVGIVTAILA